MNTLRLTSWSSVWFAGVGIQDRTKLAPMTPAGRATHLKLHHEQAETSSKLYIVPAEVKLMKIIAFALAGPVLFLLLALLREGSGLRRPSGSTHRIDSVGGSISPADSFSPVVVSVTCDAGGCFSSCDGGGC